MTERNLISQFIIAEVDKEATPGINFRNSEMSK
jgi:hypothetical protein